MNLPLELRFIADSEALLSPAGAALPQRGGSGERKMSSAQIYLFTLKTQDGKPPTNRWRVIVSDSIFVMRFSVARAIYL